VTDTSALVRPATTVTKTTTTAAPTRASSDPAGMGLSMKGACDDGNNDDNDACLSACIEATCGDGKVHEGVEQLNVAV